MAWDAGIVQSRCLLEPLAQRPKVSLRVPVGPKEPLEILPSPGRPSKKFPHQSSESRPNVKEMII